MTEVVAAGIAMHMNFEMLCGAAWPVPRTSITSWAEYFKMMPPAAGVGWVRVMDSVRFLAYMHSFAHRHLKLSNSQSLTAARVRYLSHCCACKAKCSKQGASKDLESVQQTSKSVFPRRRRR